MSKQINTKPFYNSGIPSDWDEMEFGEFAEIIMGQSPEGNTYNQNGDGVALINGPTEFTEKYPVKVQWTTLPTKICKEGDILLCVRGSSTGRLNIANEEYCIGRGVAAIRAKKNSNHSFLEFQIENIVNKILSLTTGSTFPNIDSQSLKKIKVSLPPLSEQKAIAHILSLMDTAITKNNLLIEKKLLQKKWLMQMLLTGKKRLKGFSGKWNEYHIGDVFEFVKSYSHSRDNLTYDSAEGSIYNIHYGDIHAVFENDVLDLKTEKRIPFLKEDFVAEFEFLKDGDIIIADASEDYEGVGESIEIKNIGNKKVIAGLHTIVLRDNSSSKTADDFRAFLFNGESVLNSLRKVATGISVYGISKSNLASVKVSLPTKEEQTAIAQILQAADKEIQLLKTKTNKLKEKKKGLMQVLLTGKKRLKLL